MRWPLLFLAASLASASAQIPDTLFTDPLLDTADILETTVDVDDDDLTDDVLERLNALRTRPVDLNTAPASTIGQIPELAGIYAGRIVTARIRRGPFERVSDLLEIEGIDEEVLDRIAPFVTVSAPDRARIRLLSGVRGEVLQRVQRRLDLPDGYRPERRADSSLSAYLGTPERILTRLRVRTAGGLSANLLLDKRPGEPFLWEPAAGAFGYDFVSGHVALASVGPVERAVVGDFSAGFGQGLVMWRQGGFGKGRDATRAPLKSSLGLRPYGSSDEDRYLRGIALTVRPAASIRLTGLASHRPRDATIHPLGPDGEPIITGFPTGGYHRTPTERERRHAATETVLAVNAEYDLRLRRHALNAKIGLTAARTSFSAPVQRTDRPDLRFAFSGRESTVVGTYIDAGGHSLRTFAEVAASLATSDTPAAVAALGGVLLEPAPGAEFLVLGRRYPTGFVSFLGHAFGERNGATQNESGIYLGLRLRTSQRWTAWAFYDQYSFPFLRFNVHQPSRGAEALAAIEFRPRRWVTATIQARSQSREIGVRRTSPETGATLGAVEPESRQTLRMEGALMASPRLRLRTRIEGARYTRAFDDAAPKETDLGMLLFQDIRWQVHPAFRIDARLTYFDTDSWGARVYQLENELTGGFTVPALSGRGSRAYILATLRALDRLTLQVKYAQTHLPGAHATGTGLARIDGDRVRDLGVQLLVRL